jgi:hypothetical protein
MPEVLDFILAKIKTHGRPQAWQGAPDTELEEK